MMRYEAVIFDLDGTLLDTLGDLAASTNRALDHVGLPQRSLEEVRQFVGNGVEKLIRRAVPTGTSETRILDCLDCFKKDYMLHMRDQTAPYVGILSLLRALRDNGCKVAVVSNKFDGAVKELCREHFGDLLPVAIGERPGVQKKPARDLVDLCIAELDVSPDQCVYVGDSDVDIQTAANAGLPCLSVSWGFRSRDFLLENGATVIVDTPETLFNQLYTSPTRKSEESLACLFSVPLSFSTHLTKWEDSQLPDKYDHNAFKYVGQPSVEEFQKAITYQREKGANFVKLEGRLPLENPFGMEEDVSLTMVLSAETDHHAWKTAPDVVLRAPDTTQLESLERKHYGALYGESFTVRNVRRLHERVCYHGAYLDGALVGVCFTYSTDGYTCIDGLLVDREHRHRFIATTLLQDVVETARKRGDQVFLHADAHDTPKDMYAAMGFEVEDRLYEYLYHF